jgi:hypothetical protein
MVKKMYEEEINKHWQKIIEISEKKDISRIDELRMNTTLLHQFLHRKMVFENGTKQ